MSYITFGESTYGVARWSEVDPGAFPLGPPVAPRVGDHLLVGDGSMYVWDGTEWLLIAHITST